MTVSETPENFYQKADSYWKGVDASVNGMLGGLEELTHPDITASEKFLSKVISIRPLFRSDIALDCGAGIGRVTKDFLQNHFKKVDLVEQNPNFISQAKNEYLKDSIASGKIGELYCSGLQDFIPEAEKYSAIWSQWVLGHLTDDDLLSFILRCKKSLSTHGIIFVKENIAKLGSVLDEEDSSFTRSDDLLKEIFRKAGLSLILEETQPDFPEGLYKVKMYALEPSC